MTVDANDELARLRGASVPDSPQGHVLIRIPVECEPGNAETVLSRVQEVLEAVVAQTGQGEWPEPEAWKDLLPKWFIKKCANERTAEENESWLRWWRSLPPGQQALVSKNAPWTLLDWLHWFAPGPDQRQWSWWAGTIDSESELSLVLAVDSWPTAHGAFDWIIRASGATPLEEQPVP